MRYIGNDTNLVRDAVVTATNVIASNSIFRTDTAPKVGGGGVALSGDYTGGADTSIDVAIVDDTISGAPRISASSFGGVGNGAISAISAISGSSAQTFTITLEDLGTQTLSAYTYFQGITLRSKVSGTSGNLITLTIDRSALVLSETLFALQEDIQGGSNSTNEYTGESWNFGAVTLNADGTIPDTAPRIVFDSDPQVYRQFRKYRDGQFVYSFSPAPVRTVPKGARVHAVTGTYSISITNGTTTDSIPPVTTLYDALSAIRANSTLVNVEGLIKNDKVPSGEGMLDLSVWTRPYVTGVIPIGGDAIIGTELSVIPDSTSPTETLTIQCKDSTTAGSEVWSVRGDVSGKLLDAVTNAAYADGHYSFTIPLAAVVPNAIGGAITIEYIPTADGRETLPSLCPVLPIIGASAKNGKWEYVYTARPVESCDCDSGDLSGGPIYDCLGIIPPGGNVSDESRLIRLQRLTAYMRLIIGQNTGSPASAVTGADKTTQEIAWIDTSAKILKDCLDAISSGTALSPWVASTAYIEDSIRIPTASNGYRYSATPGTSGATEPTWPTTVGATVSDGSVTWTCLGKTPYLMWDDVLAQWKLDTVLVSGTTALNVAQYATSTAVALSQYTIPTDRNGHIYISINSGTSGGTEPTWPTYPTGSVSDGGITWVEVMNYWNASTALEAGHQTQVGDGYTWKVTTAGTTGTTEPDWDSAGNTLTDGTVVWTRTGYVGYFFGSTSTAPTAFFERYSSMCNDVKAAAGIDPDFKSAGTDGDGCWHDFNDSDSWWVYNGDDPYLPIQTGHYYHSSKMTTGPDGKPYTVSTKEFGFGPKFGCPDSLHEGDMIRITISGLSGNGGSGYQEGDAYSVSVINAGALQFGGGQSGDDTLTWSVVGSVDGSLDDYALITTALAAYSDGGIGFQITPGAIGFGIGDQFSFTLEGGHFHWRQDGGSWSSSIAISDSVSLIDGLSANFSGGAAPSWVAADQWSFTAEAVNGADNLRQPTDPQCAWTGSTVIEVTPTGGTASGILIADHSIPSDATITITGSDDNFSTTPFSATIPFVQTHIWLTFAAQTRAKYRVTIDRPGAFNWLYLGNGLELTYANGISAMGKLTKRNRMPSVSTRQGLGATIAHEGMPQSSVDSLLAMLNHACTYDDNRIAIVANDNEPEVGLVEYDVGSIEFTDLYDFEPRATTPRLISTSLVFVPVP